MKVFFFIINIAGAWNKDNLLGCHEREPSISSVQWCNHHQLIIKIFGYLRVAWWWTKQHIRDFMIGSAYNRCCMPIDYLHKNFGWVLLPCVLRVLHHLPFPAPFSKHCHKEVTQLRFLLPCILSRAALWEFVVGDRGTALVWHRYVDKRVKFSLSL